MICTVIFKGKSQTYTDAKKLSEDYDLNYTKLNYALRKRGLYIGDEGLMIYKSEEIKGKTRGRPKNKE